ncbi:MAG: hypothetical protein H6623_02535 [Bdellovibrionaceae bacterium]|nr:hypothetical protein [Pseudobdellovibrionaceae bacterium]
MNHLIIAGLFFIFSHASTDQLDELQSGSATKRWTLDELVLANTSCDDVLMKEMLTGVSGQQLPVDSWSGDSNLPYIPTYSDFLKKPKAYYRMVSGLYRIFQQENGQYNVNCNGYFFGDGKESISIGDYNGLHCPLGRPDLASYLEFKGFRRGWIEAQIVFYDIVKDSFGNIISSKQSYVNPRAIKPKGWTSKVKLTSVSGVVTGISLNLATHQKCLEQSILH